MNEIIYLISAVAAIIGLSSYMYYSMRSLLRDIARSQKELAPILGKMRKLSTLSHDDWVAEARNLIKLIDEAQSRDEEFAYRNPELNAISLAIQQYIQSVSAVPEPINKPVLEQLYKNVGEKLEGYVNAIEKGDKGKAKSEAFGLIAILCHAKDFVRAK